MTMRRLWGRANSVNVQKALWGLDESGLAYARVEAGGAYGLVADPAYRAMNPNGLVPVLEEDGFALWESNAILRYLAGGAEGRCGCPATAASGRRSSNGSIGRRRASRRRCATRSGSSTALRRMPATTA